MMAAGSSGADRNAVGSAVVLEAVRRGRQVARLDDMGDAHGRHERSDALGELGVVDEHPCPRVGEDMEDLRGRQAGVDRHEHGSQLRAAEEGGEELRAVLAEIGDRVPLLDAARRRAGTRPARRSRRARHSSPWSRRRGSARSCRAILRRRLRSQVSRPGLSISSSPSRSQPVRARRGVDASTGSATEACTDACDRATRRSGRGPGRRRRASCRPRSRSSGRRRTGSRRRPR